MAYAVAKPKTTFNLVTRDQFVGLEDRRAFLTGQMKTGSATAGSLLTDLPKTAAEINALFGADSHMAMVARAYRRRNPVTNVDVKPLADAGGSTAATATFALTGTAAASGALLFIVADDVEHTYEVDVIAGDSAAAVRGKLNAALALGRWQPWTYADAGTGTGVTFTAANKGTCANNWPLAVRGNVPGLTVTATAWTGGATDPSLTSFFDELQTIRYQTIVWPDAWSTTGLKALLDGRKNVDNDVMDGRAFIYRNAALATAKTEAATINSSEIVLLTNKPTSLAYAKGPHVMSAPDIIAAEVAAIRDLRFEDGFSISHLVVNNETQDQFGGVHTASLPYFNTPLTGHGAPFKGTGYTEAEQRECEGAGLAIVGGNRANGAIILGDMVTTWQTDPAGNDDDTWQYLNWRDTHGAIREYFVANYRKRFAQHRLTTGTPVPGYAFADAQTLRAYGLILFGETGRMTLTVEGRDARIRFEQSLTVVVDPSARRATIGFDVPMVSQLGEMRGTIKFNFNT